MDKLTAIKIKYDDGTYSDEIPVSVLSENVEWDSTHTLVDVLGSIDVAVTGTIQDQISQLFNEKVSSTQLQNYIASQLNTDITNWLNTNVNPVGSAVVVDSSLTISGAAADAKVVGNLKSALANTSYAFPLDGGQVKIVLGESNSVIVTVPRRIVIIKNTVNTALDFTATQTVTVPHNNVLYIDSSNVLSVGALNSVLLKSDVIILLYNNTGVVSGQWAYAQRIEDVVQGVNKTGTFVNGLYVNVQVSAKNPQNTITVKVPQYVIITDANNTLTSCNLQQATVYTLAHNNLLIFDHNTNTIVQTTTGNALNAKKNWTLLLQNNNGYAIGQWGYIQRLSDVIDIEKRFCCEVIPIDVIGTVNKQIIISAPTSNTFTVTIPRRVAVYDNDNVGTPVDFTESQTFTLPHNGVLYFDHTTNTIKVGGTGGTLNVAKNWTLLLMNNYGHAYGQWARFQHESIYSSPFTSVILSSRQGDAGGYPENSLAGFRHSKFVGYSKVRGSCSFTSDGVGVMFHDRNLGATGIVYDRDGNVVTDTTKNIEDYTYEELQEFDFGLYKGEKFIDTRICTLEDFIKQAKQLGQDIDIELKFGLTEENILTAYNLTIKYGMLYHTRWSNETLSNLEYIKSLNPRVTLGLIITTQNYLVDNAASLLSGNNEVWCCLMGSDLPFTDAFMQYIASKGLKTKIGSLRSGIQMRNYCGFDELEIADLEYPEWQMLAL